MTGPESALRSLVGFAWFLRDTGVAVSSERVQAMVQAVSELEPASIASLYWAGRITLCSRPEDLPRYEHAFAIWFSGEPPPAQDALDVASAIDDMTAAVTAVERRHAHNRSSSASASDLEVLRDKDIALMDDVERAQLQAMLAMLTLPPQQRPTRRRRSATVGRVDSRRTMRAMLRRGGELGRVYYRDAGRRARSVVLLLDVSASMSAYSESLLRYAYAYLRCRPRTEVFTLGTRLTRITRLLIAPGTTVPVCYQ